MSRAIILEIEAVRDAKYSTQIGATIKSEAPNRRNYTLGKKDVKNPSSQLNKIALYFLALERGKNPL